MDKIYSKEEFSGFFYRERVRSDRTGRIFSILILEIENIQTYQHNVQALHYLLRKRVRCCDVVGWFDRDNICILLSDTDEEGARILAENLRGGVTPKKLSMHCRIFSYPSHWFNGNNDKFEFDRIQSSINSEAPKWSIGNIQFFNKLGWILPKRIVAWKRVIDICGSILGLLFLSPVFGLVALYIKAVSPGPIFFKQQRVGFMGNLFHCWKFKL